MLRSLPLTDEMRRYILSFPSIRRCAETLGVSPHPIFLALRQGRLTHNMYCIVKAGMNNQATKSAFKARLYSSLRAGGYGTSARLREGLAASSIILDRYGKYIPNIHPRLGTPRKEVRELRQALDRVKNLLDAIAKEAPNIHRRIMLEKEQILQKEEKHV